MATKNNQHRAYSKLKGYFVENGIRQAEIACLIGVTTNSFNQKINCRGTDFTPTEIRLICNKYKLSADEYFFYQ